MQNKQSEMLRQKYAKINVLEPEYHTSIAIYTQNRFKTHIQGERTTSLRACQRENFDT